jgi:AcrR family transcriptional regulator
MAEHDDAVTPPPRGRPAEAARNDTAILDAARTVFLRDPAASMAAVAAEAGVGVGGLYRRYESKDALLQKLCGDGLRHFVALADSAVAETGDAWGSFARFVTGVVDSDVHSLTVRLGGTFTSTEELRSLAAHSTTLVERLVRRAQRAGVLRKDVGAADLPMVFEQLSAVRVQDAERTTELRRRYLALHLDALRVGGAGPGRLPGPGPTAAELGERWSASH